MSKRVEELIEKEDWRGARKLIRSALREEPNSHWFWTRLGLTFYEERRYVEALKHERKALDLAPQCPLVDCTS